MALDTTVSSRLTYKAPSPLSLSSFPAARGALLRAACVPPPRGAPFRTWHADVVGDPALVFGAMLEAGMIIMLVQLSALRRQGPHGGGGGGRDHPAGMGSSRPGCCASASRVEGRVQSSSPSCERARDRWLESAGKGRRESALEASMAQVHNGESAASRCSLCEAVRTSGAGTTTRSFSRTKSLRICEKKQLFSQLCCRRATVATFCLKWSTHLSVTRIDIAGNIDIL